MFGEVFSVWNVAAASGVLATVSTVLCIANLVRSRAVISQVAALTADNRELRGLLAEAIDARASDDERIEALVTQVERLAYDMSRDSGPGDLREAIALSKHGASARQIEDACGLSEGEARLVLSMHGVRGGDAAAPAGAAT